MKAYKWYTYLWRILVVLTFIPRLILSVVVFFLVFPIEYILFIPAYYILTGESYIQHFAPLHIVLLEWFLFGEFFWKIK